MGDVFVVLVWHRDSVPEKEGRYLVELTTGSQLFLHYTSTHGWGNVTPRAWTKVPTVLGN